MLFLLENYFFIKLIYGKNFFALVYFFIKSRLIYIVRNADEIIKMLGSDFNNRGI